MNNATINKNDVISALYNRVNTTNWCRLGRAFKTKYSHFFYDAGTGKIFEINRDVYTVLNTLTRTNDGSSLLLNEDIDLEKAINEILISIEDEHILSAKPVIFTGPQVTMLEDELSGSVRSITLEVSEECNLRCKYCVYSDTHKAYREHGQKKMTEETAQKAVDFLISHSEDKEDIHIGFYGGEPLTNWHVIEKTVAYVKSLQFNKPVNFAMTSNLTLMTPEIAHFIASTDNFSVLVSLDGPKHINDRNRVFNDGRGTFDDIMRGYHYLLSAFKNKKNKENKSMIMFNTVIPTVSDHELEEISAFFQSFDPTYIGGALNVNASRVSKTSKPTNYMPPYERMENKLNAVINPDPMMLWGQNKVGGVVNVTEKYIERSFVSIHKRPISDLPFENTSMNACCTPGARKLYVKANGDFIPCERLGDVEPIGNVYDGLYVDTIKRTRQNTSWAAK